MISRTIFCVSDTGLIPLYLPYFILINFAISNALNLPNNHKALKTTILLHFIQLKRAFIMFIMMKDKFEEKLTCKKTQNVENGFM